MRKFMFFGGWGWHWGNLWRYLNLPICWRVWFMIDAMGCSNSWPMTISVELATQEGRYQPVAHITIPSTKHQYMLIPPFEETLICVGSLHLRFRVVISASRSRSTPSWLRDSWRRFSGYEMAILLLPPIPKTSMEGTFPGGFLGSWKMFLRNGHVWASCWCSMFSYIGSTTWGRGSGDRKSPKIDDDMDQRRMPALQRRFGANNVK